MSTKQNDWQFFAKSFLAGGLAGMISKTTVAPLDRIKILLQVQNVHYRQYGIFTGLNAIVQQESFLSLYKGNGAQMVRMFPFSAVQYMSYEAYNRVLDRILPPSGNNNKVNHELKLVAGSAAGVTSVLATYPLDLVRARLASIVSPRDQTTQGSRPRPTILGTIVHVFKHEGGLAGLYRGITPGILGMIPYGGCTFYIFERLKHGCVQLGPGLCCYRHPNNPDQLVLTVPAKLLCGGLAGALGQTAVYPLDVARRRMQLSMTSQETEPYSKGFLRAMTLTYRTHGIVRGLYRGMSVNYVRVIPIVGVSFCTYEVTKQLLGLETGVDSS